MADDIDILLNDADRFINKDISVSKTSNSLRKNVLTRKQTSIERDIDDILNEDFNEHPVKSNDFSKSANFSKSLEERRSCRPAFLCNSQSSDGISTTTTIKACDKLRCTDCDFAVVQIKHRAWNDNIDYLFLRNNFPDLSKLHSRLKSASNSRAYCCQCKHYTCVDTVELSKLSHLHWVCGRH